jgi:hypothetical protein
MNKIVFAVGVGLGILIGGASAVSDAGQLSPISQTQPAIMKNTMNMQDTTASVSSPNTLTALQTFEAGLNSAGRNTLSGDVTPNAQEASINVGLKYTSGDSVLFVSTTGSDSNDGLSPGTAKLTISGAYSALPSCTFSNHFYGGTWTSPSWTHCGKIYLAAGTYTSSSQISISSPYVEIRGTGGPNVVTLTYTGTSGCYFYWTESPFPDEFTGFGGLFDVVIDGRKASAGTCGIETDDASGIRMDNVLIMNFVGSNSMGWYDHATNWYNEKQVVHAILRNNTTGWQITPASSAPHYPGGTSFGYGQFNIECEVFSGETCLSMTNGTLSQSNLKLTINMIQPNTTGISITNSGSILSNLLTLHIEAPPPSTCLGTCNELSVISNSFSNVGLWNQDNFSYNNTNAAEPQWPQRWPTFSTLENNSASVNKVVRLNPCPVNNTLLPGCNVIDIEAVPSTSYITTTWPAQSGTLANVVASGTLSVTAGDSVGCVDQTTTASGATTGMKVLVSPVSPQTNTSWSGYVSAANTVDIHVCTIVALTGSAVTYNWSVIP